MTGGGFAGAAGGWRGSTAVLRNGARREFPVNDGSGTLTAVPEAGAGRQQPAGLRHTTLQPAAFSCPGTRGTRGTRERAGVGSLEALSDEGMKPLDGSQEASRLGFILKITPACMQAPRETVPCTVHNCCLLLTGFRFLQRRERGANSTP